MNRPQAIRAKLLPFEDEMACFIVAVLAAMQFFSSRLTESSGNEARFSDCLKAYLCHEIGCIKSLVSRTRKAGKA